MNQAEQLNNLLESLIMFTAVFAAVLMILMVLIVGTCIWLGQRDPNRKLNRRGRGCATPEEIQRARDIMHPELPPVKFEQDFMIDGEDYGDDLDGEEYGLRCSGLTASEAKENAAAWAADFAPVICPHCNKHTDKDLVEGVCERCFMEAEYDAWKYGDTDTGE